MGREYATYLEDCIEWGGDPMTYEEFLEQLEQENQELELKGCK